ncbi:MAG: hypothetical protein KDA33_00395, partial [Phycisphaerales bacterium]|nr:hypothetical protein [Phycisphaerales bacterium]
QKVRAHSQEIVGSIIPGAAELAGKTHLTKMDGMDVYQIRLADASESPMVRNNIAGMYGAEALYQETVVGDDTIVYTIGGRNGVRDLANVLAGKSPSLTGNARVREEMKAMPADANLYALMDTSRFVSSIPLLMRAGMGAPPPDRTIGVSDKSADRIGPLLGWSAKVQRNHVDAAFTMKARDLRETIDAFRRLKDSLENPTGAGGGANSELAIERPVPFVRGD